MLRVGIEYNTELQKIVQAVDEAVFKYVYPVIEQEQPNYTADGWGETILVAIDRVRRLFSGNAYEELARMLASRFVRSTLRFADRQNQRIGIEVFNGSSTKLNNYMEAAVIQNVSLIKSLPERYLENVANSVLTGMRAGVRPEKIAEQLREDMGVASRRAKFIARDQAAKVNGEITKQRQIDAGFEYFKWVDAHDQRVRHRHREIAKADIGYGTGVYRWDDLPASSSGETIQPGQDYNCFPGNLPVNIYAGVNKLYRYPYRGELTELVADNGVVFSSTPNHPVLTDRGFVAACDIKVGDNIVYIPDQRLFTGEGYSQSPNIEFSKLFESLKLIFKFHKTSSPLSGNFHGDYPINEQIDIISFDWELPFDFKSEPNKRFVEFLLSSSDQVFVHGVPSRNSDLFSVIKGMLLSPDSVVSGLCELLSIGNGGLTHSDKHSFAAIGLLYSVFIQNSSDDISGCIEFFSDCFDAEIGIEKRLDIFKRKILLIGRHCFGFGDLEAPGSDCFANRVGVSSEFSSSGFKSIPLQQELITVTDKRVSVFSGHVFNLEMKQGLFVSQNIAVSNCRCVARPVRTSVVEKTIKSRQ